MHLSAMTIYPVKSCRGIPVESATLSSWGLTYDRNWMVVNAQGKFLTQREHPTMALVQTSLTATSLVLTSPVQSPLEIPLDLGKMDPVKEHLMPVQIWRDQCLGMDQGDPAAAWFSHELGVECRLVRLGQSYDRPVDPFYSPEPAQVSFADGYPLLLISEGSLQDLNTRLANPIPMSRFRPNLVVTGCAPYAEDTWTRIQIGSVSLDIVKPCARCVITTTDQLTGERPSRDPLETLATYRRDKGNLLFGQNLVHRTSGTLQVGDPVVVLETNPLNAIPSRP